MKGKYEIIVKNARLQYKFTLERNITILRGDSATGKTTLIDMIASFQRGGKDSGVTIQSEKPCVVLTAFNWLINLSQIRDSFVFIDEGDSFVKSTEFAAAIKETDNYYVIATRASLFNLPYSTKEIYGIKNKSGNRYQGTKRLYSEFYPLCNTDINTIAKPDIVIVEDSNSGYNFFKNVFEEYSIPCISAKGKNNIYRELITHKDSTVLVIADGAAFGPEIERIVTLTKAMNVIVYLPESFEWIILKSGLIPGVAHVLEDPASHIESQEHFSWERFFTSLLIENTQDTYLRYRKSDLNPVYLHEHEKSSIINTLPEFDF
jgi:hypothetical protein